MRESKTKTVLDFIFGFLTAILWMSVPIQLLRIGLILNKDKATYVALSDKQEEQLFKTQQVKLSKYIRKLTTYPDMGLYHYGSLTVYPATRSGGSERNRIPHSESQRTTPPFPVQVVESNENERNRLIVTSATSVFSSGRAGSSYLTIDAWGHCPAPQVQNQATDATENERNRGLNLGAQHPSSPVPVQATDATEGDSNHHIGNSSTPRFLARVSGSTSFTVSTTDLNSGAQFPSYQVPIQEVPIQVTDATERDSNYHIGNSSTPRSSARVSESTSFTVSTTGLNSGVQFPSYQVPIQVTDATERDSNYHIGYSSNPRFSSHISGSTSLNASTTGLNSRTQYPSYQVPIQATDDTERDSNQPMRNSSTPRFSSSVSGSTFFTASTTGLNSRTQWPSYQVPIQATDDTERDSNQHMGIMTTATYSARVSESSSACTVPTTGRNSISQRPMPATDVTQRDSDNNIETTNAPRSVTPGSTTISLATKKKTLQNRLRAAGTQVTPRYPEYENQSARQRSFANWPSYTQQQSARLIPCGFFYTGQADLVRCFQCGIGLKNWSPGDEPLCEHVRHSPRCAFLQQLQGDERLGRYRDSWSAARQRNGSASAHGLNIQAPQTRPRTVRHPDRSTVSQRLASFSNWPHTNGQSPRRLAEAGLFHTGINDQCRCFTCDGGLKRWDKDDDPWLEHARWFPHCTYVREVKGQDYINLVLAAAEQAMKEDELNSDAARAVMDIGYSKAAVQLAIRTYKNGSTEGSPSFTAVDLVKILLDLDERVEKIGQDRPDLRVETRGLRGIEKCMKCNKNDCNILFLPCAHHRLCETCAEHVTHCPVCGRKVGGKVRTYM